ncbi:putative RNA polymerase sigma factor [Bradyrhizobium sp. LB7.2]|nr:MULTISPECIES: hypothetical protein [unclassified Bradyrhizobium]
MSEADTAWIETALTSARPQAVGALLRYFRDLDTAEEAFQNACLRALKTIRGVVPPSSEPLLAVHARTCRSRSWAFARAAAVSGANLVVSFYFANRGFENVARIIKR